VRSNGRTETGDELAALFGSRAVRMQVDAAEEYFDSNDMLIYVKRRLMAGRDWAARSYSASVSVLCLFAAGLGWLAATRRCEWLTGGPGW
jgi:hypothetical protein